VLKHKGPAVPVPMELVLLSEGELPNWTGEVSISVALLRGTEGSNLVPSSRESAANLLDIG
jgi:hypothetical protein